MNSTQGGITLRSAGSRLLGPLALGRQFWVLEEDPSLSLHGSFCSISVGGLEAGSDSLSLEEGVGRDAVMGDERLPGKQARESRRSARGKDAGAVEPAGRPVSVQEASARLSPRQPGRRLCWSAGARACGLWATHRSQAATWRMRQCDPFPGRKRRLRRG